MADTTPEREKGFRQQETTENWEGINHITIWNVIYPNSALCKAGLNGYLEQTYSSVHPLTKKTLLNKHISIRCRECEPERLPCHSK